MAEVDVKKIIKDLADTDWGKDNEAQMKAVQLLKGLALSEDPESNKFMKALSDASTNIGKKMTESEDMLEQANLLMEGLPNKPKKLQEKKSSDVTSQANDLL